MIEKKIDSKKKFSLVLIVGESGKIFSFKADRIILFTSLDEVSDEKIDYLRADLIVFLGKSLREKEFVFLKTYLNDKGRLYAPNLKDKNKKYKGFLKAVDGVYSLEKKREKTEYNEGYLSRWGDTDFMKNWKGAGLRILAHKSKEMKVGSMRVLDVGCLNGYIMETLRRHGVKNVYGTDLSYYIAIEKCVNTALVSRIRIGDFVKNSYPSSYFDMTICMEVLEHVPREKMNLFLQQLNRVTKEGGKILVSASEDERIDPTHVNCRKRYEWYYYFCKFRMVPKGRQMIFPGFNSFVFVKKEERSLVVFLWQVIFSLYYVFSVLGKNIKNK